MGTSAVDVSNLAGAAFRASMNLMLETLGANPAAPFNLSLAYSVGSNALTIAAKQQGGSNASATAMALAAMRSATATSGDYNVRTLTAALSLVVSSGSTLGHENSDSRWVYVYLIDNAGTLELAVSSKFFGFQGIVSTTTEGGAGAADSATVMYSTTARSNVSFICIGRFVAPQTVAGTWAAAPTSAEGLPFEPLLTIDWTATLTGGTTAPTYTCKSRLSGTDEVRIDVPLTTVTSNATGKTLTGMPQVLWPVSTKNMSGFASDNGGAYVPAQISVSTAGVITLTASANAANWTNSGTMVFQPFQLRYCKG